MAEQTAKIVLSAEDKTAAAFSSFKANLTAAAPQIQAASVALLGFSTAAGAAAAAIAVIASAARDIDAFNDLKDATGASIENISALDRVARETGGTFDSVATTLVKFNAALNKTGDDTKPVSNVLKALGLDADELKKKDPAQALLDVATAFQGFKRDGDSARAAQLLFGKSIQEVAPFLKDLAEKGKLVSKTTTEAAEQAEIFNKQLAEMRANSQDTARAFADLLIPTLNTVLKGFREIPQKLNILGTISELKDADAALRSLESRRGGTFNFAGNLDAEIAKAKERLAAAKKTFEAVAPVKRTSFDEVEDKRFARSIKPLGPIEDPSKKVKVKDITGSQDSAIQSLKEQLAAVSGELSEYDKVMERLTQGTWKNFNNAARESTLALAGQIDAVKEAAKVSQRMNAEFDAELAKREDVNKAIEQFIGQTRLAAEAQAFETSLIGKGTAEREKLTAARYVDIEAIRLSQNASKEDRARILEAAEFNKKMLAESRDLAQASRLDWSKGMSTAIADYLDEVGNAAKQSQQLFTNAFKSMEDALVEFAKTGKLDFKSLADSIISDIIRIQIRQSITKPLAESLGGLGGLGGIFGGGGGSQFPSGKDYENSFDLQNSGGGLSGFFSNIFGGFRAEGGPVNVGKMYRVGERGPETFIPDVPGRIIPAGNGGGGQGGNTFVFHGQNNKNEMVAGAVQAARVLSAQDRREDGRRRRT